MSEKIVQSPVIVARIAIFRSSVSKKNHHHNTNYRARIISVGLLIGVRQTADTATSKKQLGEGYWSHVDVLKQKTYVHKTRIASLGNL